MIDEVQIGIWTVSILPNFRTEHRSPNSMSF